MDHFLHFFVCLGLTLILRQLGFSVKDTIFLVVVVSIGKELCDAFIDTWDLIGDGYGILVGLFINPKMKRLI